MSIKQYLDSTYLNHSQAGIKESQNMVVVENSFKKPLMKTSQL
jgi:hypothetical protein